jgi:hypothetical protein
VKSTELANLCADTIGEVAVAAGNGPDPRQRRRATLLRISPTDRLAPATYSAAGNYMRVFKWCSSPSALSRPRTSLGVWTSPAMPMTTRSALRYRLWSGRDGSRLAAPVTDGPDAAKPESWFRAGISLIAWGSDVADLVVKGEAEG